MHNQQPVFPAPAGMNRDRTVIICGSRRVPRACGDEPGSDGHYLWQPSVFPAPAGMNRAPRSLPGNAGCVPRACGDEPS